MNNFDNTPGNGAGKPSSSMRRLLSDGMPGNPAPLPPVIPTPVKEQRPPFNYTQFIIPAILVLVLLIGVGILAYSFGVNRGESNANLQRDNFIQSRQLSWEATATADANNPIPTAAPDSTASTTASTGYTLGSAIYARVDKIDGDQISLLLLDQNGQPNGTNLTVNRTKQTQIWKVAPNQPIDLRPGDSVLFVSVRSGDTFNASSIQVLPTNS